MKWSRLSMAIGGALFLAGCGMFSGTERVASATQVPAVLNPSIGTDLGAASGQVPSTINDPCTLNAGNPVWRDHGGAAAFERRCGHPPPP
ncbi:MAG TPA: hypothetical protein VHX61_16800 [Rhizomicrobium sp.]|nr:hypothetical protein [Rhizomicrobium sp.]